MRLLAIGQELFANASGGTEFADSGEFVNLINFANFPGPEEDWFTPENAVVNDGNYAVQFQTDTDTGDILQGLELAKKIPDKAIVLGLQVRVERHATITSSTDVTVQLFKNGTLQGDNKADTVTFWPTTDTDIFANYGGVDDLWSLAWTSADINASNFGIGFAGKVGTANNTLNVDQIQIAITYK